MRRLTLLHLSHSGLDLTKLKDKQDQSYLESPNGWARQTANLPIEYLVALGRVPGASPHILSGPPDIYTVPRGKESLLIAAHFRDCTDIQLKTSEGVVAEWLADRFVVERFPIPLFFKPKTDVWLEGGSAKAQLYFLEFDK